MARRHPTLGGSVVSLVAVIGLCGSVGVFAFYGGAVGQAPSRSSPPWGVLTTNPAVYDAAAGYDLWLLASGTTWSYAQGHWDNLTSSAGVPVDMEDNARMVYDAADGAVVLFGGAVPHLPFPPLNETWLFSGGRWVNDTSRVHGAPPAGVLGMMTYDSADGVVVLYGEQPTGQVRPVRATWVYTALNWTNESVAGPPPIVQASQPDLTGFADDPSDGYVVFYSIFGGCRSLCPILWTYAAGAWTNRTATVNPLPSLTLFDAFTFDSSANEVLAVGGCDSSPGYTCRESFGTFAYRGGNWTDITPASGPAPREFNSWVDDPSDDGVMVVGGCCWADFTGLSLMWQDVWIFAHGHWSEQLPWGGGPPSPLQNDGFWVGIGTLGVPIALVCFQARPQPASGRQGR